MNIDELRFAQARFEPTRQMSQDKYKTVEKLRKEFVRKFTRTKIESLGKEDYVLGRNKNGKPDVDTFCYWVEWKTAQLGRIRGATSSKFGLYIDKKTQKYKITKKFSDENQALNFLKKEILKIIDFGSPKRIEELDKVELSPMFKGKILFLYFPKNYLNIFSEDHVAYFLNKIGLYQSRSKEGLVYKRDILLEWKNNDDVMKDWSTYEFSDFLYHQFEWPEIQKNAHKQLKNYFQVNGEYPDLETVQSEFLPNEINLADTKPDEITGGEYPQSNIDYEKQHKARVQLGERGEQIVLRAEKSNLISQGCPHLIEKVKHIPPNDDRAGYDIISCEIDGRKKYVEVKSTTGSFQQRINFFLTANEYKKAHELDNYYIYIVFEASTKHPKIWKIINPFKLFDKGIYLKPLVYKATALKK